MQLTEEVQVERVNTYVTYCAYLIKRNFGENTSG